MSKISFRDFMFDRVDIGDRLTVDGEVVTLENFDSFSDRELKRAVFHGIALKGGRPHKIGSDAR